MRQVHDHSCLSVSDASAVQPLCDSRNSGVGTISWPTGDRIGTPEFQESHKQAIYPVQPSAVALLRLSATINQIRMFPRPRATINDDETRDLELKTLGVLRYETRRTPHLRSRVCGISLETKSQGIMCALLTVADSERARTREAGTGRWPTFCGLCRFAPTPKLNLHQMRAMRETAQTAKTLERLLSPHPPLPDSVLGNWNRAERC